MAVLSHLTIIEAGSGIAMAFCGKLLADAGARVIKIEPPEGDPARRETPRGRNDDIERSPLFLHLNTNKESVTIDLTTEAGAGILRRLAEGADVLLESLAPGTLASMGAAPEELRASTPALVVASITPYGQTGPYRDYAASDITLFASTGSMYREGLPGREPMRYAGHQPRMFPGTVAAGLVVSALLRRRATGLGDWIDVSEMDCWASHPNQISRRLNYAFSQDLEEREDTKARAGAAAAGFGRGTYRCLDGYVTFLPLGDRHWPRLVDLVEQPELADDPRFATREARRLNRDGWEEIFQAYIGSRTVAEVFARAQWAGIPSGPLNDAERLLEDMHLGERAYLREAAHPRAGVLRYPGAPANAGEEFWSLRSAAPLLGADTERVLGEELGLSDAERASLLPANAGTLVGGTPA